jgi:methylenetetrahydrofolate reductase (NADPH)
MDFSLLKARAASGGPTFSVEFFPPKDEIGEERLWDSLRLLASRKPDFVSVTYGAGGSTRDRTIRVTSEITERTAIPTVAHLTCVGASRLEIGEVLRRYIESGISTILALRGDPPGGPRAPWTSTKDGLDHADQLVELAIEHGMQVGVAAFPDGHPASGGDFERDLDVLERKFRLGATFATTQFFFDLTRYQRLVDALSIRGVDKPVIAGILPITNYKQLMRMAELGGTPLPSHVVDRISRFQDDPESLRREGIEIAKELAAGLIAIGAPGLHFYTMNSAHSTLEIISQVGIGS